VAQYSNPLYFTCTIFLNKIFIRYFTVCYKCLSKVKIEVISVPHVLIGINNLHPNSVRHTIPNTVRVFYKEGCYVPNEKMFTIDVFDL